MEVHMSNLSGNRTRLFLHVHELDTMITIAQPRFNELAGRVYKFIAASELVKEQLVRKREINENKISVVYEFAEIPAGISSAISARQEFVVCAAGTVEYRKGFDIFIEVARRIKQREPEALIRFTWVGRIANHLRAFIETDLERSGLTGMVWFTGEMEHAAAHIADCDVFLLPSREDPFPLVCIEAGMLGKPIICFDKATGINEVIAHGGGHSLPFGDTGIMADTLLRYYHDRSYACTDGVRAKELFASFTPEIQCQRIFNILNE